MQNLAVAVRPRTELGCAVHFPADEGLVYRRKPAKPGPAAGLPDEHDPLMTSGHWLAQRPRLSRGMATIKALRGVKDRRSFRSMLGSIVASCIPIWTRRHHGLLLWPSLWKGSSMPKCTLVADQPGGLSR